MRERIFESIFLLWKIAHMSHIPLLIFMMPNCRKKK
jgi:hypothetical protein